MLHGFVIQPTETAKSMYPPQVQTRQGLLSGSDATFASHIVNIIRVEEEVAWQSRLLPNLGNRSANEFQGTFHGPHQSGNTPPDTTAHG